MNKSRKTSHILNVFQYDETTGAVTLPSTLSLTAPSAGDNSSKVATTAWARTFVASLSYLTSGTTTTSDIGEGTNLYYTQSRFNTAFGLKTTTDLTEGANLYYTDSRVGTYLTNNSYATQSYVGTQLANLVAAAPATLDTLNELAAALGNDPSFATTVSTSIGTKVPQTRTLTINGTAYDLSADRAWTITSMIYPGAGIAVSTGTAWGTSITDNSTNWNTAYGWGNHASAGYLTSSTAATTYVSLTGSYANPSWVTSLAYSKITGVPAFLTSYTETDPYRVTAVAVSGTSTKTITITRADASTVTTTWTDIDTDTNTYVTSAAFSGGTLTLTRNDAGTVSVSLDGRYYLATNPSGYITGITSSMVTTALGYTPYNSTNPNGYITGITSSNVTTALGFTPYNSTNPSGYITSYSETDTLATVVGRGNTTGGNIISSANMYASVFYDYTDNGYYLDPNSYSSLWGIAIRGDNSSTGTTNQITFWGGSMTTTSAIGFKANGGAFPNPTGFGDGYNTYLTMDTDGRGWVFRRGTGGTDFSAAYTAGWILNNGIAQFNASVRSPIFYDSEDTGYYLDPNSTSNLYRLNVAERIRLGTFPNSTSNSGEAWIGRASDRNSGTMTVQLGGGSASSRSFEVVDYAWSTVLFSVGSNGNISASGTITASNFSGTHSGSSSGTNTGDQNLAPYLLKSGGTMTGTLTFSSISGAAQTVPNSYGAYLHLGAWAVARTAADAVLVNTAYRADYATDLFDMNISRFTNNSGYLTSVGIDNMTDVHRLFNNMGNNHGTYQDFNSVGNFGVRYMQGSTNGPQSGQHYGFTLGLGNDYSYGTYATQFYWLRNTTNPYIWIRYQEGGSWGSWTKTSAAYADSAGSASTATSAGSVTNGMYLTGTQQVSGQKQFQSDRDTSSNSAPLQAFSMSGGATMAFHRSSVYAINFGLDSDNVIRFGGWSAGTNRFQMDMSGNLTMAGDVTAYSDARVKENIATIENALNKVLALRGVSYNRIDSDDKKTKIGVIAQETLPIVPEVVNQDNDGMFNVSYGNLAGLFIEAIKEQQKEIEELKTIIYGLTR